MASAITQKSLLALADRLMRQRVGIPAAQCGRYQVRHEYHVPGDKLLLASMRDTLYTGVPRTDYVVQRPMVIHKLEGPQGTWMTDLPCELVQMHRQLARHARGRVLVGGLGLGIVVRMIASKPAVHGVTVVERQAQVCNLVAPHLPSDVEVVKQDIYRYVKGIVSGRYDVALLDTWQSTGEYCWQMEVVPLRRSIGRKIKRVHCWNEAVMQGQLAISCFRAASLPAEIFKQPSQCHAYAFRRALMKIDPKREELVLNATRGPEHFAALQWRAEHANREDWKVRGLIWRFLHTVGSPSWERMFGQYWDEALEAREEKKVG